MLAFRALPHTLNWNHRAWLATAFVILAVVTFLDARRLVSGAQNTGAASYYFADVDDQGGNAAGYLATYLLPFLGLVPTGWGDWVGYVIYFAVAAVVFIRTNLALINPTLYLLRWRVVSARAFLDEGHSPNQQVGTSPVVVVCRDPTSLTEGRVDVVTLAGSLVTKREVTKSEPVG